MTRHFGGAHAKNNSRMRVLVIVSFALMVVFASLGAVFFYSSHTSASVQPVAVEKTPAIETAQVLVPLAEIPAGTALEPGLFKLETRPVIGLSSRAVRSLEEIKGAYSRAVIGSDQPLSSELVTKIRPNSAITVNIPDGYPCGHHSCGCYERSVEGWAKAGSRVDVVWASTIRGKQGVTVIVEDAKILSAERQTGNAVWTKAAPEGGGIPNTVTLLVTSDDAAKIQLASTAGSLSLSLRGDNSTSKGTGGKEHHNR